MDSQSPLQKVLDVATTAPAQVLFAGLMGGVLRWLTTEKDFRSGTASLIAGGASAIYLGPPAARLVASFFKTDPNDPQLMIGVGFVVGLGGISLIAFIISIFRALNTQDNAQGIVGMIMSRTRAAISLWIEAGKK